MANIAFSAKSKDRKEMNCNNVNSLSNEINYDTYVVKHNDTIESVAALFNTTPSKLCYLNRLTLRTLFTNQKLKVITPKESVSIDPLGDTDSHDSPKNSSSETSESPEMSPLSNNESDLFPLLHQDNYLKVHVKYITDTEGIINGTLLLTPVSLTFLPAFKDPVVHEYGVEKFRILLPNSKIACVSMYNDSDVMAYKRSQRLMCNQIIVPSHKSPISAEINEVVFRSNDQNDGSVHPNKLSLILEDEDEKVDISTGEDSATKDDYESKDDIEINQMETIRIHYHNYLCVIASPRYRKTKAIYQNEDEYWFMIPICNTETVLEYLLVHGRNKYDVGANVDAHCTWPGDSVDMSSNGSSPSKQKFIRRNSSFTIVENLHNENIEPESSEFRNDFGLLREKSMDWEIINNDFDLSFDDDPEFAESAILNTEQSKELMYHIPNEAIGAKWELVYGTSRDGWSLRTLYRNVFDSTRNACILVIKDTNSNIFGALCNTYIRLSKYFYGNGSTFLFRWYPHFQIFKCTLKNNYILYGDPTYFVIGSSNSKNAIRLHSSLSDGITQACDTFDSPPLTENEFFQTVSVEVWSFY